MARTLSRILSLGTVSLVGHPLFVVAKTAILICVAIGRSQEKIARVQESYLANATTTWLESLERSLAQMKEYQVRIPTI
jgi:hypothetical protein